MPSGQSVVNAVQLGNEETQGTVAEDYRPEQLFGDRRNQLHMTVVVERDLLEMLGRPTLL